MKADPHLVVACGACVPSTSGSIVDKELGAAYSWILKLCFRQLGDNMLKLFSAAALLGAAFAQNSSSLPTVDLGYEIYRAANFNVG